MSGVQPGFQRVLLDMSGPHPRHVRVSDTSNGQIPLGATKGLPHLSSPFGHSVQLAYSLKHSLELKLTLPQASLQTKVSRRDLSHLLSDPLNLQAKHFIDNLCVFVSLGDLSPRWTRWSGCHQGYG
jgi:hypothetical protein